jgi:hypothetical protein
MTMIDPQDAFRAAINVLRDSVESGKMPSGIALWPRVSDLHARAANCLETMLKEAEDAVDGSTYFR